jgi:hypothetical protein
MASRLVRFPRPYGQISYVLRVTLFRRKTGKIEESRGVDLYFAIVCAETRTFSRSDAMIVSNTNAFRHKRMYGNTSGVSIKATRRFESIGKERGISTIPYKSLIFRTIGMDGEEIE